MGTAAPTSVDWPFRLAGGRESLMRRGYTSTKRDAALPLAIVTMVPDSDEERATALTKAEPDTVCLVSRQWGDGTRLIEWTGSRPVSGRQIC